MPALSFDTVYKSHSPEETENIAAEFYATVAPSAVVALYGPLGSGKTCFVRGLAIAAGIGRTEVSSPSFTLINEYRGGRTPIFHFDLYRLKSPVEFYAIGGDEYMSRDGIILIEWAENGGRYIPESRIDARFSIIDESMREISFTRCGR